MGAESSLSELLKVTQLVEPGSPSSYWGPRTTVLPSLRQYLGASLAPPPRMLGMIERIKAHKPQEGILNAKHVIAAGVIVLIG